MPVGIPASKIDYSQVTLIRKAARAKVEQAVLGTTGQTPVVRDVEAWDLSNAAAGAAGYAQLSNVKALVANTWDVNDNGAFALPNNRAIAIFAYWPLAASPLIQAIRFLLGSGAPLAIFNLVPAYLDMTSAGIYFDPPVFFYPGQVVQYDLLSQAAIAAGAEPFYIGGYVAETAGLNVLQDDATAV